MSDVINAHRADEQLDIPAGLELLECMQLIRVFETTVQSLFQKGDLHGTTHLYIGQEAGAVGVASALEPGDRSPEPTEAMAMRWRWASSLVRCSLRCWDALPESAVGGRVR